MEEASSRELRAGKSTLGAKKLEARRTFGKCRYAECRIFIMLSV